LTGSDLVCIKPSRRLFLESSTVRVPIDIFHRESTKEKITRHYEYSSFSPPEAGRIKFNSEIKSSCGEICLRKNTHYSEVNSANVGRNDHDNQLNVNEWNAENGNDNIGAVPAVVSRRKILFSADFAWRILSIRQAFCLFPEVLFEALNIFYLLLKDCL